MNCTNLCCRLLYEIRFATGKAAAAVSQRAFEHSWTAGEVSSLFKKSKAALELIEGNPFSLLPHQQQAHKQIFLRFSAALRAWTTLIL